MAIVLRFKFRRSDDGKLWAFDSFKKTKHPVGYWPQAEVSRRCRGIRNRFRDVLAAEFSVSLGSDDDSEEEDAGQEVDQPPPPPPGQGGRRVRARSAGDALSVHPGPGVDGPAGAGTPDDPIVVD